MGAIGGLLGTAGGANGTGFAAPSTGNIVTPGQLTAANNYTTNALGQQQAFTNAVGANGTAGLAAQGQVLQQLQQGAAGQGPNPALAQLNQTTGQNVANQSALMAGQRGASQNAGLIARQAAQQGAATQQQAAGQAATQQAQQQIAYQQALAGQANAQVAQQGSAIGAQTQAGENQQNYLTSSAAGLQNGVNAANAALAGQQMSGQQGLLGGLAGGIGASGILGSGIASAAGAAQGGLAENLPKLKMAQGGQPQAGAYDPNFQGLSNAAWSSGQVPPSAPAPGQMTQPQPTPNTIHAAPTQSAAPQATNPFKQNNPKGPKSNFSNFLQNSNASPITKGGMAIGNAIGQGLKSMFSSPSQSMPQQTEPLATAPDITTAPQAGPGQSTATPNDSFALGGKVPAMVSPGERYLPPSEVKKVAKGEKSPMKAGEKIPGKPKVGGAKNSYANDTVPKTLDEGGIVLPRSVTQHKNPDWAAHKFVRAIMAKNGGKI